LRIFNRFFTHLLYVHIYARLQIFIHLSPILTKLCHINPLTPSALLPYDYSYKASRATARPG